MDFSFTPEQDDLRQTVRKFLDDKSDEQTVRKLMTSELGYDREVWTQLAEQLGLAGLIIPEALNGAGLGFVDLAVVLEEMGRTLLCAPFLSTAVLATNALLHARPPRNPHCSRISRQARRSPPWPSRNPTAAGSSTASPCTRAVSTTPGNSTGSRPT
jgi:alkylation response protein AidB-like acyl-CoA dehydrogenase